MKVAGTSSLQELFVSTHCDTKRVDHLVPMILCCGDDVVVLFVEILDFSLKEKRKKNRRKEGKQKQIQRWRFLMCSVPSYIKLLSRCSFRFSFSLTGDEDNDVKTRCKQEPTRLRDLIPSTGRWKPIPKDFTTTRMLLRDSLRRRRRTRRRR